MNDDNDTCELTGTIYNNDSSIHRQKSLLMSAVVVHTCGACGLAVTGGKSGSQSITCCIQLLMLQRGWFPACHYWPFILTTFGHYSTVLSP